MEILDALWHKTGNTLSGLDASSAISLKLTYNILLA